MSNDCDSATVELKTILQLRKMLQKLDYPARERALTWLENWSRQQGRDDKDDF